MKGHALTRRHREPAEECIQRPRTWLECCNTCCIVPGATAPAGPAITVYLKPSQLKSVQGLSHAGDPTGIGLGWIQLGDPDGLSTLMEKTGGGAGFETYIALSLKRQTGIFVAVTEGKGRSADRSSLRSQQSSGGPG